MEIRAEDKKILKSLLKKKAKGLRIFVARKMGGNARGRGADRSVILGSMDGKEWGHAAKIWGFNNEIRAAEIVRLFKEETPT